MNETHLYFEPFDRKLYCDSLVHRGSYHPIVVFQHAYFDSDSLYYDIAMIKLAHSPNLNLNVNTVAMASPGNDIDSDTSCYITGWGKTVGKFAVLLFEPAHEIMVLIT